MSAKTPAEAANLKKRQELTARESRNPSDHLIVQTFGRDDKDLQCLQPQIHIAVNTVPPDSAVSSNISLHSQPTSISLSKPSSETRL